MFRVGVLIIFHRKRKPTKRSLLYPTFGAYIGAWLGVIPIGLDWGPPVAGINYVYNFAYGD